MARGHRGARPNAAASVHRLKVDSAAKVVDVHALSQGWPNCGSSNLCMRLFELSEKLYICLLFFIFVCKV